MRKYRLTANVFGLLFFGLFANVHAATVTIHDVLVMGQAVPGSASGNNCAEFTIGTAGGTNYGNLVIQGADGINPAKIQAVENGANCYGITVNQTRDQLVLANTRVTPTSTGVNVNLTIEYRADFGPVPDGTASFGGSMKGVFRNGNVAVTCGAAPPNGPCQVTYSAAVVSQGNQTNLQPISSTNPFNGLFNVTIPLTNINVGTGLNRTFRDTVTIKLPSTNHRLEVTEFKQHGPPLDGGLERHSEEVAPPGNIELNPPSSAPGSSMPQSPKGGPSRK
jgi:hypothetical protein